MARAEIGVNHVLGRMLRTVNHEWDNDDYIKVEEVNLMVEGAGLKPDILLVPPTIPPAIIETSFIASDADRDAKLRLNKTYVDTDEKIHTVIAVVLDLKYRDSDPKLDDIFRYSMHQIDGKNERRFPETGFLTGTIKDISRLLASTSIPRKGMDKLAKNVGIKIKAAATTMKRVVTDDELETITSEIYQRSHLRGLNTACLLWLNAFQVQKTLSYTTINGDIPRTSNIPTQCLENWKAINEKNWKAIFEPSIKILESLINHNAGILSTALQKLIKAVELIEVAKLGSEKNIGAELFPILADDRETSAAYYTQSAPAEFLCSLTIQKSQKEDWSDPSLFDTFKIADLACGTGTLLRYAYKTVRTFHNEEGGTSESCLLLHKSAMQNGLYGTDVSPIAAHLTSSSLAVVSGQKYNLTNIGWVAVGNDDRTGSIEYMTTDTVTDLFDEAGGTSHGGGESKRTVTIKKNSFDAILMNPPYTRTRGGLAAFDIRGMEEKERKKCQDRWGKLIKDEDCSKIAGMAATFVCIAAKKLKPGGRMGFVLPRSAATTDAWQITRSMVETNFKDITAIVVASGKAMGKTAISTDTMMEEMYLVATKLDEPTKMHNPIRTITLHEPVLMNGIATEKARAIMDGPINGTITIGDSNSEIGVSRMLKTTDGSPWNTLDVKSDVLDMAIRNIEIGVVGGRTGNPIEMTTIGELFNVGDTHHIIGHRKGKDPGGYFSFVEVRDDNDSEGDDRSLWRTRSNKQTSLVVRPTHKGSQYLTDEILNTKREAARKKDSRRKKKKKIPMTSNEWLDNIKSKKSDLFMARAVTWNSQALVAARTPEFCFGGRAWTSLVHDDDRVKAAMALWANSVYGIIAYWATGSRAQVDARTTMQVYAISQMKCPNFTSFSDDKLNAALVDYDRISTMKLQPCSQAVTDEVRININKAVSQLFDIDPVETERFTKHWCVEPSITKRKKAKSKPRNKKTKEVRSAAKKAGRKGTKGTAQK